MSTIDHVTYSEPLLISSRLKALAKPGARRAKVRSAEDAWKATITDGKNAYARCIIRRANKECGRRNTGVQEGCGKQDEREMRR